MPSFPIILTLWLFKRYPNTNELEDASFLTLRLVETFTITPVSFIASDDDEFPLEVELLFPTLLDVFPEDGLVSVI